MPTPASSGEVGRSAVNRRVASSNLARGARLFRNLRKVLRFDLLSELSNWFPVKDSALLRVLLLFRTFLLSCWVTAHAARPSQIVSGNPLFV